MMRRLHLADGADGAARLDAALDELIGGRAVLLDADDVTGVELLATARLLHEELPRFHPRFGFEERLAGRLRGGGAPVLRFPVPGPDSARVAPRASVRRRGLVAGGAIASGLSLALPLAGAALVAWRRSRPTGEIG